MTTEDILIAQINLQNAAAQLTTSNVAFGNPVADAETQWNTRVTISALPHSGLADSVDVYYDRINLQDVGNNVSLVQEAPFTVQSLLDALNAAEASTILLSDLQTVVLPNQTTGVVLTVPLTANAITLGWYGTT